MTFATGNEEFSSSPSGLHVVYGSRTRRGLTHANEDRHGVSHWEEWNTDAYLGQSEGTRSAEDRETSPSNSYPAASICTPLCTGSARKDTTVYGCGATGDVSSPFGRHEAEYSSSSTTPQPRSGRSYSCSIGSSAYLWTVCDGHDGPEAADYVCKHISNSFAKIWHNPYSHVRTSTQLPATAGKDRRGEDSKVYAKGFALSNALARTFESLDSSFKAFVTPETAGAEGRAGCTAGSVSGSDLATFC